MSSVMKNVEEIGDLDLLKIFCLPTPPHANLSRAVAMSVQWRILEVLRCDPVGAIELDWDLLGEDETLFPVAQMAQAVRSYLADEGITEMECSTEGF